MSKFFVIALPRSRTYWLADFLGCIHDGLYYYPNYADFMKSDNEGDSTTCHLMIRDFIKDERKVIIHRDIDEVRESLHGILGNINTDFLHEAQEELKKENGLHVNYEDIDDRIEDIWHQCRPDQQFPVSKYMGMRNNIMNNEFIINKTRERLEQVAANTIGGK